MLRHRPIVRGFREDAVASAVIQNFTYSQNALNRTLQTGLLQDLLLILLRMVTVIIRMRLIPRPLPRLLLIPLLVMRDPHRLLHRFGNILNLPMRMQRFPLMEKPSIIAVNAVVTRLALLDSSIALTLLLSTLPIQEEMAVDRVRQLINRQVTRQTQLLLHRMMSKAT